jgi:hypothetical protein
MTNDNYIKLTPTGEVSFSYSFFDSVFTEESWCRGIHVNESAKRQIALEYLQSLTPKERIELLNELRHSDE